MTKEYQRPIRVNGGASTMNEATVKQHAKEEADAWLRQYCLDCGMPFWLARDIASGQETCVMLQAIDSDTDLSPNMCISKISLSQEFWEKMELVTGKTIDYKPWQWAYVRCEPSGKKKTGPPTVDGHASATQIGGTHYLQSPIQPWDFIVANDMGFLAGNVVKYVSRYRRKHGLEDLKKAAHYLAKLIEVEGSACSASE